MRFGWTVETLEGERYLMDNKTQTPPQVCTADLDGGKIECRFEFEHDGVLHRVGKDWLGVQRPDGYWEVLQISLKECEFLESVWNAAYAIGHSDGWEDSALLAEDAEAVV